uniref:Uncharacterized protein n=1 Tax=Romanomermis culicivorax TaxID=13658 RepID=A0A915KJU3_ROMCU
KSDVREIRTPTKLAKGTHRSSEYAGQATPNRLVRGPENARQYGMMGVNNASNGAPPETPLARTSPSINMIIPGKLRINKKIMRKCYCNSTARAEDNLNIELVIILMTFKLYQTSDQTESPFCSRLS